jgi:hypothetical protein
VDAALEITLKAHEMSMLADFSKKIHLANYCEYLKTFERCF